MRYYKLLKDVPTFKAGGLFYISEYGALVYDDGGFGVMAYAQSTLEKFPNILTEWFEEIQEPTSSIHWKPKIGDRYWALGNTIVYSQTWGDDKFDRDRYESGKVYKTKEEAEKARERELAEVRLRRTSNFKPDFENGKGGWIVFYDHECETLAIFKIGCYDSGEPVHYATREEAEKSIEENEQDWKIYFGIYSDATMEFIHYGGNPVVSGDGVYGKNYRLVAIEMKRRKGGVTSANQKKWIKTLNEAGIQTVVCKGCDAAIEFIESITKS